MITTRLNSLSKSENVILVNINRSGFIERVLMNTNIVNVKQLMGIVSAIAVLGTFAVIGSVVSQQPAEAARSAPSGHPDCQHLPGGCSNGNNFIQGTEQYDQMRSGHASFAHSLGKHSNCHFC
jgi:hypothetical protein